MSQFNIDFEVAAVAIDVIMILLYYQRRSHPSAANVFYKRIMVLALGASVTNIITVRLMDLGSDVPYWLNYSLNILYFVLQNILPAIFVLYTAAFLEVRNRILKKINAVEVAVIIGLVLILVSTPFTHIAFRFDSEGIYHRGMFVYVLFGLSFVQLAVAGVIALYQRKKVKSKQKLFSIFAFVVLLIGAVIIQLVFTELLVTGFANSCACLIMYMVLQSPNDSRDESTGLFRRNTFLAAVTESYRSDKGFIIISVIPNNSEHIIAAMGRDIFVRFMGKIGEYLSEQYSVDVFSTEEGAATIILDNPVKIDDVVADLNERFENPWIVSGMTINSTCSVAYTGYPEPLSSVEDIVPAVDYMISQVKSGEAESPFYADNVTRITDRVGELEAEKRLLEEESKEAAQAKERAERENRQKNVFLANMSHEIRTPMNAILGMTSLVLRDDINPRVRDMMEEIHRAGDSLLAIINDLLDVTKIESDKFELNYKEYSLKTLIADAVTVSSSRIQSPDIELLVEIQHHVPDNLFGDENRLKQVFVNLLNNAIKYTHRGHVKLTVGGEYDGDTFNLRVDVEDTGSGIKDKDKEKLFNTFSRALNEENANVEGTGLGLAICKRIITFMGGDIDVESTFGVGSRFFFNVPQHIEKKTRVINDTLAQTKGVLICTKDRYDRRVEGLKNIMFDLGIPYYVVTTAAEAKTKMNTQKITDVFITRAVFDEDRKFFEDAKAHLNMIYDSDASYDDIKNAGMLYEPVYVLNVQKLLEERKEAPPIKELYKAPSGKKILVVDDNLVNLKVITQLLKQFGIDADTASGGAEGIEKAGTKKYDLIFMDHMMPEIDGIEAMNSIRRLSPVHGKMPIVMLTANVVNGAEEMFRNQRFDEFVSKPVSMERLEEVLKKFLK